MSNIKSKPRRFMTDQSGSFAIEFAIVSTVFIFLLIGFFQVAMIYLVRDALDMALQDVTRTILTGSFQQSNLNGAADPAKTLNNLKTQICTRATAISSVSLACSNMKVDVSTADSFTALATNPAVNSTTKTWASDFGDTYTCPSPRSIASIRVALKYPVFATMLSTFMSDFADGSILIQSGVVLRTEAYASGTSSAC